jgi:hypothetical protein
MAAPGVADEVQKGAGAYWRDLVFSRLLPALFFSVFLARQLLFLWDGLHSVHNAYDYLFVLQQLLALAYFTMLVVLYTTRLPKRGTDHRVAVVFIAFTGTFSAIVAPFLPAGGHREGLVVAADLLATLGLAYSVWGLAYLRRSFSIIPEARRLVTGGPYSLSRHPVYLGEIVAAIGVNLATAGWPGASRELSRTTTRLTPAAWPATFPTRSRHAADRALAADRAVEREDAAPGQRDDRDPFAVHFRRARP